MRIGRWIGGEGEETRAEDKRNVSTYGSSIWHGTMAVNAVYGMVRDMVAEYSIQYTVGKRRKA